MQSAALPPAPLDTQGCALRGVRVPCQAPAHVHTCVCWVCESSERPRTLEMLGSKRCLGCCDSCVPGRQFLYTKAQGGLWHSVYQLFPLPTGVRRLFQISPKHKPGLLSRFYSLAARLHSPLGHRDPAQSRSGPQPAHRLPSSVLWQGGAPRPSEHPSPWSRPLFTVL